MMALRAEHERQAGQVRAQVAEFGGDPVRLVGEILRLKHVIAQIAMASQGRLVTSLASKPVELPPAEAFAICSLFPSRASVSTL
jgi:hypothetical protein